MPSLAAITAMAAARGAEALPRWPGMGQALRTARADLRAAVGFLDRAEASGVERAWTRAWGPSRAIAAVAETWE